MSTDDFSESQTNAEQLKAIEAELREACRGTPPSARNAIFEIVRRTSIELADQFYNVLINQPGGHFFLDHELVNKRLHQAVKHWLDELFQRDLAESKSFTRTQMQAGWVHARIKVPEHLVSRGFRELKKSIGASLRVTRLSREELAAAIQFVSILLDLALDVMTCAYITRSERSARSDEAFRLFTVSQNLGTERERQRAALSEWAQSLFFELQMSHNLPTTPLLSQSDFGLWIFHRAILMFDHSSEYDRLVRIILDIDDAAELLRSAESKDRFDHLRRIKAAIDEINALMTLLFDRSLEAQGARDPLTQLLNRKFINTVISAEIAARRHATHPFSILLIEIDQFDNLRARLGEAGADIIVQRTAQIIFDTARMSDSVFSMGRETFLVVHVEADLPAAKRFAETISERYASTHFNVNEEVVLDCRLSIGVVEFDGHPDPRQLVNRAQRALFEEKTRRPLMQMSGD